MPEPRPRIDPLRLHGALFDLDGVVTRTAVVHAAAWKRLFDEFLERRAEREGVELQPFDIEHDYRRWVDGKPRHDGVRGFLAARGIELPAGSPDDPPERETVYGLGKRKNAYFHEVLAQRGVQAYDSTVDLIRRLRGRGVRTALFSASRNAIPVLDKAGLRDLFEAVVEGRVAQELGLPGKPAPDTLIEAARRLDLGPEACVVFEDAEAGVAAARRGGFALVIGVDRTGNPGRLTAAGAHAVVGDLAEIVVGGAEEAP